MRALRSMIAFFGFTLLITTLIYSALMRPRVLIIQSYNTDYSWTRQVDIGLKNILSNYKEYQITWHYMDAKNHPDQAYLGKAGLIARGLVDSLQPSILILIDDEAQNYVGRFYLNDPSIKLVFAGVNGLPKTYGYDQAHNVTGILERIPLEGLRDILIELARLRNLTPPIRILHLSDGSARVRDDDNYIQARTDDWWHPIEVKTSHLVNTFEEWQTALAAAQNQVDFIIISNYEEIYTQLERLEKMPADKLLQWTVQNSTVPIVGVNDFVTKDGAGLSIMTSPIEQGEVAAKMAVKLLKKQIQCKDIPFQTTQQFVVCIREKVLKKDFPDLPSFYENFARYAKQFWG